MRVRHPGTTTATWWAPGRVNLIGEHTDYNNGLALPFAVPAGVTATATARDEPVVSLRSAEEAETVCVELTDLQPGVVGGWAAYAAGAVWAVMERHGIRRGPGLDIQVGDDVPGGAGLSSFAAVVCSVAGAVADLFHLELPPVELVAASRQAESDFVGAPTGALDQMASVLCTEDHALLIDFDTMTCEQVPLRPEAFGLSLLVTDTGVHHANATGGSSERRQVCAKAGRLLGVDSLRDVGIGQLPWAMEVLAGTVCGRASRHVITENERVVQTVDLLRKGEPEAIGPLLDASHDSLRRDFKVSWAEADTAVEAAQEAGALGARMTGDGFGGCTVTLARTRDLASVRGAIADAFADAGYRPPRFWTVRPSRGAHPLD